MQDESTIPVEWRPVVGYEGVYAVSSTGHVCRVLAAKGATVGAILKAATAAKTGYLIVALSRDNTSTTCNVHQLVAAAFLGPCPEGMEVNHKDRNRRNAAATNLEYLTRSQNTRHAMQNGARILIPEVRARGERVNTAKLTEDAVRRIRTSAEASDVLARRYGITRKAVNCVRRRKTWQHVV